MPTTSDSPADLLDVPIIFVFDDPKHKRRWELKVSGRTLLHESLIQRLLEKRAYEAIQRGRSYMTLMDYEIAFDRWLQQCATGVYAVGDFPAFKAMQDREVKLEDTWLHFQQHDRSVSRELVGRIMADPVKSVELVAILERANDPNRERRPADQTEPAPQSPSTVGQESSAPR